jgi:hypothetical protein
MWRWAWYSSMNIIQGYATILYPHFKTNFGRTQPNKSRHAFFLAFPPERQRKPRTEHPTFELHTYGLKRDGVLNLVAYVLYMGRWSSVQNVMTDRTKSHRPKKCLEWNKIFRPSMVKNRDEQDNMTRSSPSVAPVITFCVRAGANQNNNGWCRSIR